LTDRFNNPKQKEIDDFFSQFDKISNDFNKSTPEPLTEQTIVFDNGKLHDAEAAVKADLENREKNSNSKKTRMERLSEDKTKDSHALLSKLRAIGTTASEFVMKGSDFVKEKFLIKNTEEGFETGDGGDGTGIMGTKAKRKKHKKYRLNVKKLVKFIVGMGLVCSLGLGIFTLTVIAQATVI